METYSVAVHTVHDTRTADVDGTLDEAKTLAEAVMREFPDVQLVGIRDVRGVLMARWERGHGWEPVHGEVEA